MTARTRGLLIICWLFFLAFGVPAEAREKAKSERTETDFDDLVAELKSLGLQITADPKKIGAATGEAAYFMFAENKNHRPRCMPFKLSEAKNWLDKKPVFSAKARKEKIRPLLIKLVKQMGYTEVSIYAADVHYGVSSHADFKLYKFGYGKDDKRKGREILLGDVEYVMKL
jgi:hypothetical protein